ncbi:MAG: EamA family transporter RarD [Erythrobacter sp.]|nr:MAG: EamA family transporter RarD [Erythrobacter sp.]
MDGRQTGRGRALLYALMCHCVWGSMPLYLILVDKVPALEYVAWRTLFTLPLCLLFIWRLGQFDQLRACMRNPRALRTLVASSAMIAINWYFYVWAIQNGNVYAASLGYYILPLNMMLLGMLFLGERLTRVQWLAVGLAAVGVAALATGAFTTLWLSLLLGTSFGIYGLLRKTVEAGPIVGLTVEGFILLPLVGGYLLWLGAAGEGLAFGRDGLETFAIVMGGPMTAIPLILFASAARALPYTLIGFLQFISPTVVFLIGLFVFGQELSTEKLVCFIAIWSAVALFSWDMWRNARAARAAEAAVPV